MIGALMTLPMFAACGDPGTPDDDTIVADEGPADDEGPAPEGVSQPAPEGRVLVALYGWGGQYNADANVTVDFFDGPMRMDAFSAYSPMMYAVAAREGDCVLYVAADVACDPVCDWSKICQEGNKCVDAPARVSAGHFKLTAGTEKVEGDPSDDEWMPNYYYFDPGTIPAAAIAPTVEVKAEAAGATDGIGSFALTTGGVNQIEFGFNEADNTLTLVDGEDAVVTWTTSTDNAAGAYVDMVINEGWHGSPPEAVLYCRADASDGQITIPKAVVEAVPQMGGPALMGHGSHIGLSRTVTTEVDGKTIEFTVTRRHGLNVLHNAPEW